MIRSLFQGIALLFYTGKIVRQILPALGELLIIYGSFYGVSTLYSQYVKSEINQFPDEFLLGFLPAYSILFFLCLLFSGAYAKRRSLRSFLAGSGIALLAITFVYAFARNAAIFPWVYSWGGVEQAVLLCVIIRSILIQKMDWATEQRRTESTFCWSFGEPSRPLRNTQFMARTLFKSTSPIYWE